MRLAFLGCGFVADYYATTLPNHPELELVGVYDRDPERGRRFAAAHGIGHPYDDFGALLGDARVDLVINLTNPDSHRETTQACLLAGKHVYSEKPLAMEFEAAEELVRLAEERGLSLSGGPCNLLGEAAQTTWKALRDGVAGRVRLAYAEVEDGSFDDYDFRSWVGPSGTSWPFVDEFETGIALEHAAYLVSWLAAFFGPITRVTSYASVQAADLAPEVTPQRMSADLTVSCLEFGKGEVARVTCGRVATSDRTLRIFGQRGVLSCGDAWNFGSPVSFRPHAGPQRRLDRVVERIPLLRNAYRRSRSGIPLVRRPSFTSQPPHVMDFARGVADQAAAIREGREPRLSARFTLHVNEVVLAMQPRPGEGQAMRIRSTFDPIEPMPWAK